MQPRITNPALSVPGVLDALQGLSKAANKAASQAGLPQATADLVSPRASQINGCAVAWTCTPVARRRPAKPTSDSSPCPPGVTPRISPPPSGPPWL